MDREELLELFREAQLLGCSVIIEQGTTSNKVLRVTEVFELDNIPDLIEDEQGLICLDCWHKHNESEFGVDVEGKMILPPSQITAVRLVDLPSPENR